jgi:hypothetical protein
LADGVVRQQFAEALDRRDRDAVEYHLAAVHDDDPVAESGDLVQSVAHDDDRAPLGLELADLVETLALELLVADGEDLVDEQDIGVGVDGDRERKSHVHAR